jgi:CRP-like cAMP-binding protein
VSWPLLDVVPQSEQRRLLALAVRRKFAKSEVVFHEGDPADSLHLVAKGHFVAQMSTPLGDIATVRVFQPGDFFGELGVLLPGRRNATIFALEPSETLVLHSSLFEFLRGEHPLVVDVVVEALVCEVRRLSAALVEALFLPVEQRLWRRLLELAASYGSVVPVRVALTQEDIAQLAGTTRSTANRILRAAQQAGVVRMERGMIEIRDLDAVRRKSH